MDPRDALQTIRTLIDAVDEETPERNLRMTIETVREVVRRGIEEGETNGGGAVSWKPDEER